MPDPVTLAAFAAAVVALSLTPGPDMLLVVGRGIGQGSRMALCTAAGFTLAGLIQIPLLALGVAALVRSSPLAFDILRYAGAAYLIWRGVRLIRQARRGGLALGAGRTTPLLALRDGMVASLTNPKGLVFMLAFLPQFVAPERGSVMTQLVLLGLTMKLVALAVEGLIAVAAGAVGGWLARRPGVLLWQERVTGAILIVLGLRLLAMGDGRARI